VSKQRRVGPEESRCVGHELQEARRLAIRSAIEARGRLGPTFCDSSSALTRFCAWASSRFFSRLRTAGRSSTETDVQVSRVKRLAKQRGTHWQPDQRAGLARAGA
jgi:hypothetical protein